jgi:hypothetical protein
LYDRGVNKKQIEVLQELKELLVEEFKYCPRVGYV